MYKKLINNPVGLILTSATLILVLSPRARQGTRNLLVKGAGTVLALGNQVKDATAGAVKQLGSIMEEAKEKKEQMHLPAFSQSMQETGQAMKEGIEGIVEKTKAAFSDVGKSSNQTMQEQVSKNEFTGYNVMNNERIKEKLNEIENQIH